MASGLFLLLDDIATVLDDMSVMTKIAAKKTAGILGDDLALNAQQVTGVHSNRELPVVWAVAKGSLLNKAILVPSALLLSSFASWAIEPLMILGGGYLCFEGCEKIVHKWRHPEQAEEHKERVADENVDLVELEKTKVRGAIRTDFILSAEIVVITLGSVSGANFWTQVGVLIAISLIMTVGVYGLVGGIVKLDDAGLWLINTPPERTMAGSRASIGRGIIAAAPYLMRLLSIAGTAAMFLVGGGILAHGIEPIHHWIEHIAEQITTVEPFGGPMATAFELLCHAGLGIIVGTIILVVVIGVQKATSRSTPPEPHEREGTY